MQMDDDEDERDKEEEEEEEEEEEHEDLWQSVHNHAPCWQPVRSLRPQQVCLIYCQIAPNLLLSVVCGRSRCA
jgi:hypothetical protein